MVLLFLWITANDVSPAHLVPGRLRWVSVGLATIGAAFLIYGTFEWLQEIWGAWSLGDRWLLVASLPLRALAASICTAIALVPQLRRAFGPHSALLCVIAALPTGISDYCLDFTKWLHWHAHWLSNYIRIFTIVILPLVLAATAERWKIVQLPNGRLSSRISQLWRGDLPVWAALVIVYPMTIAWVLWLMSRINALSNHGYSDWEYATRKAIAQFLLMFALVIGTMVTWRCLNRSAEKGKRSARWLQGIVALSSAPIVLVFVFGAGFHVGDVITNSAKAALGSAYDLGVRGRELELSGEVNYGLADRLENELKEHPSISKLRLDSVGGSIAEAMYAANIIAAHNLDTVVSEECVSACTVMFIAGKNRTLEKDGKLGFHAARSADPTEHLFGSFRAAYARFGVDREFVARVEAFNPPGLWYPTREELVAAGVLSK